MRIFAQRSSGVLGGLCFYENFRTEKQRGFGGGLCFYEGRPRGGGFRGASEEGLKGGLKGGFKGVFKEGLRGA